MRTGSADRPAFSALYSRHPKFYPSAGRVLRGPEYRNAPVRTPDTPVVSATAGRRRRDGVYPGVGYDGLLYPTRGGRRPVAVAARRSRRTSFRVRRDDGELCRFAGAVRPVRPCRAFQSGCRPDRSERLRSGYLRNRIGKRNRPAVDRRGPAGYLGDG